MVKLAIWDANMLIMTSRLCLKFDHGPVMNRISGRKPAVTRDFDENTMIS